MARPSRRIFSPGEKRVRENLQARAWQKRNPEKVKAAARARWKNGDREHFRVINAAWRRAHRERRNLKDRRAVRLMKPYYLRFLLRLRGIHNPTPAQFEEQRQRCLLRRRKHAILQKGRMLANLSSCSRLTSALPTSSPR